MLFIFDLDYEAAFEKLKSRLLLALILRHYDLDLETMLEIDASNGVIAEVLS